MTLSYAELTPWLTSSGTPLFPEYTDHGPAHIEAVLQTADALIADEAFGQLTAEDVATLAVAVLLHDSAMHLSEDGFLRLTASSYPWAVVPGFGDVPWPELWETFLAEAARFDGRRLTALFGTTDPVRRPSTDPANMTLRDRLLIGEFVRRHHHRLAHEIAVNGVPGVGENPLRLVGIPTHLGNIAGLVARSHGLPIRTCVAPLKNQFNEREFKGIHAVFLMGLLRLSDYLQIQAERAPASLLRVRRLLSPASRIEWGLHDAVTDVRHTHEDPEAIFVEAHPPNVNAFLRLREWLVGVQHEMDSTWAVLGETYGRYAGLNQLGYALRRVRSNLLDVQTFATKVAYVPRRVAFDVANPDLLKLMVGPLYGDRVGAGLRELVQNAVDAVLERRERFGRQVDGLSPAPDIAVSIEKTATGDWSVTVTDHGIGMSLSIVSDYFLKAGASYRRSDAWRGLFEGGPGGHARVLRSGRFGVGALAAFLIGDRVEVSTRRADEAPEAGLKFVAGLDDDQIEITKVSLPIGTTVRIQVSEKAKKYFEELVGAGRGRARDDMDGYCLADPVVERRFNQGGLNFKAPFLLPSAGAVLSPGWNRIAHTDYSDVHWTYHSAPDLSCNGIIVTRSASVAAEPWATWWSGWKDQALRPPKVSAFDPDGKLPLTLQRNEVSRVVCPFGQELLDDVARDVMVFALTRGPSGNLPSLSLPFVESQWNHPALLTEHYPFFLTTSGFGLLSPAGLRAAGIGRVLLLVAERPEPEVADKIRTFMTSGIVGSGDAVVVLPAAHRLGSRDIDEWVKLVLRRPSRHLHHQRVTFAGIQVASCGVLLPMEDVSRYQALSRRPFGDSLWSQRIAFDEMTVISDRHLGGGAKCASLARQMTGDLKRRCGLWNIASIKEDRTALDRAWSEILRVPLIPYDLSSRTQVLSSAYDTLRLRPAAELLRDALQSSSAASQVR